MPLLDLGITPLANSFLSETELGLPEARYPLVFALCGSCGLVQITETASREVMFGHYPYFSSYSDTMLRHAKILVTELIEKRNLNSSSTVIEIASNDGYLLQYYVKRGIPVLGIEPARNIAEYAQSQNNIPTIAEFFSDDLARSLVQRGVSADVVHAHNVLAHVPAPRVIAAGISEILKPEGIAVIEVPYLRDLIEKTEFDTIYHEHMSYFSMTSLQSIWHSAGLEMIDATRVPIHGGSLRVTVARQGAHAPSGNVAELQEQEAKLGIAKAEFYRGFEAAVHGLGATLTRMLRDLRKQGSTIAAFGAAAKGNTLLNVFHIGRDLVDFVVDRNPHKQGLYTPGTHLPVLPPTALMERRPQYTLLLAWNLADEILEKHGDYLQAGGRFILPIPEPRIL